MNQGKREDQTEFSERIVFGAMGGIIVILLFCIFTLLSQAAFAQKVYSTTYPYEADVKVYVCKQKWESNSCIYITDKTWEVDTNIWKFVDNKWEADIKIHFVKNKWQADNLIYFVDNKWQVK